MLIRVHRWLESVFSVLTAAVLIPMPLFAQSAKQAPPREKPMVLTEAIPLENAKGRFDHFAMGGGRLFVAALGSNLVEAINIGGRVLAHALTGIPDPQGIAYSPETRKIFAASGRGKVYIYDGGSYQQFATLDFEGGADNLRYDAANKRVYVACGDDEKNAAIATIDAVTNKRLPEEYKLGAEPESFQLEKSGPHIYVNLPGPQQVVAINRATKQIARWPLSGISGNFPMALDEAGHRLFIGTHAPPRMVVIDTNSAAWSPRCRPYRIPTISTSMPIANESTW